MYTYIIQFTIIEVNFAFMVIAIVHWVYFHPSIHFPSTSHYPNILLFRPLNLTPSNLFNTPLAALYEAPYADKTSWNSGSAAGCVAANARSKTYKSTALSSSCMEAVVRPKSMR